SFSNKTTWPGSSEPAHRNARINDEPGSRPSNMDSTRSAVTSTDSQSAPTNKMFAVTSPLGPTSMDNSSPGYRCNNLSTTPNKQFSRDGDRSTPDNPAPTPCPPTPSTERCSRCPVVSSTNDSECLRPKLGRSLR